MSAFGNRAEKPLVLGSRIIRTRSARRSEVQAMRTTNLRAAMAGSALALLLAACAGSGAPGPTLHTVDTSGMACAGTGLVDATLHGNPTDARVAWVDIRGFKQYTAVFPKGFTARFAPSLEVLNASGAVVFREGDPIDGQCGGTPDGGMLIGWP
jgi:hypothetical protein